MATVLSSNVATTSRTCASRVPMLAYDIPDHTRLNHPNITLMLLHGSIFIFFFNLPSFSQTKLRYLHVKSEAFNDTMQYAQK